MVEPFTLGPVHFWYFTVTGSAQRVHILPFSVTDDSRLLCFIKDAHSELLQTSAGQESFPRSSR